MQLSRAIGIAKKLLAKRELKKKIPAYKKMSIMLQKLKACLQDLRVLASGSNLEDQTDYIRKAGKLCLRKQVDKLPRSSYLPAS